MIEELDLGPIEEALEPSFSGMQDMLNEVYIKDAIPLLIAEVKRLRQDRAEVRRSALLEACGLVCHDCAEGKGIEFVTPGWAKGSGGFYHKSVSGLNLIFCTATTIHRLIAADQGQGRGKE